MTAIPFDLMSIASEAGSGRGISEDSRRSRRPVPWDVVAGASLVVDDAAREMIRSIFSAAEEASRPDWDGHGGAPTDANTVVQAVELASKLPTRVARPEITVHPDGEIGFSWLLGRDRMLTASVNSTGVVSFASIVGSTRSHGSELMLDELPAQMALALRKLFSASL